MKKFVFRVVLLCAVMISSTVSAARGIIAYYSQSSHKIVITTQIGFMSCIHVIFFRVLKGVNLS